MTIAELEEAFLKAQTAFNADKKNKKLRNKWKNTKKALNKARKKAAAEAKEKAAAEAKEKAAKEKAAAEAKEKAAKEKAAKEKAAAEEKSKKKAAEEVIVKLEKKKAKNGLSKKQIEKEKQRREKEKRKEKEKEKGAKTLFLTNLPQSMKDDDIRDFFKGYGKLDIELRKNQYTDRFTGRASVGFASAKLATKAMAEKESTDFMGCSIKIRHWNWGCENGHLLSRPLSKKRQNCNTVFIGTVPKDVDREKISEFFGPECVISEIRYLTTKKDSVKIKYAAYVEFENPDVAVDVAVGKNGQKFEGITVRVDYAKSPKKRKKSQKKSPKKRKKST